jgi:diaminopimelate epimerase
MRFHKYHALGNDYIVIDPAQNSVKLDPAAIRLICHRNLGVGSDGILLGPLQDARGIGLQIFNPDGSEAEKSGNGIRIFSRYLVESGQVKESDFTLQTLGGAVQVRVLEPDGSLMEVDMGTVTFQSGKIPVDGKSRQVVNEEITIENTSYKMTCVSIGNPHCVVPLDAISRELAERIGPQLENHPLFPNRINVQLLKVLDRNNIQIEIWERGAGYTLASGSSSCAAASAAHKLGLVDNKLDVHMPGGVIGIDIKPDGHVHMKGSVSSVASGNFSEEFARSLKTGLPEGA